MALGRNHVRSQGPLHQLDEHFLQLGDVIRQPRRSHDRQPVAVFRLASGAEPGAGIFHFSSHSLLGQVHSQLSQDPCQAAAADPFFDVITDPFSCHLEGEFGFWQVKGFPRRGQRDG